ncbi:hypothetical protein HQ529_05640 [Candidatus Woesearchaeota archaeon]|nr:hypothetical protein [Candidatus Woesearchaeota archaeon]
MKKAQVQTQVFIYIIALVVVSLIMLYGYNSIKKIREQTTVVEHIQFRTDLENTVKRISYEFGTIEKRTIDVPGGYNQICFVGSETTSIDETKYPIIQSIISSSDDNVFMVKSLAEESFYVGAITVDDGFKCFDVIGGKINIQLEAFGEKVGIS